MSNPDESLTSDESFTATSSAGLTYPWGSRVPGLGETIPVAPGIEWARLPMPGSLGHINTWLLADEGGVTAVDTGMMLEEMSGAWKALFAGPLADRPIVRVLCTHLHADHTGLAGWLCKKFDAPLWMTRGEWLTARMLKATAGDTVPEEMIAMQRAAGWDDDALAEMKQVSWKRMSSVVFPMPPSYRRIMDGDVLDMGAHRWRVVVGSGHSPEHACLWNEQEGVLVSGDQVLPRISSNVSVVITEPDADPLGEWLASIDRLLLLPGDLLVCPAHGEPFKGLHTRLIALRDEHHGRLDRVEAAIREKPLRTIDTFGLLFNREINGDNRQMAAGEALAHLHRLERDGRVRRHIVDAVTWFAA